METCTCSTIKTLIWAEKDAVEGGHCNCWTYLNESVHLLWRWMGVCQDMVKEQLAISFLSLLQFTPEQLEMFLL